MSGESIYGLYAKSAAAEKQQEKSASPYTGKYEKHMGEPTKPVYSTFFEKGKEYDGSNVRFFKQREVVIGKNVGDEVDPQNYLKKGEGVRHVVPPVHEEKIYYKPPLDKNFRNAAKGSEAVGNARGRGMGEADEGNGPRAASYGAHPNGAEGDDARPNVNDDENAVGYGSRSAGYGLRPAGGDGQGANYDGQGYSPYGVHDTGNQYADADGNDPRNATKDFVASNIVEVGNMVPKRRKEQAPLATSRKDFAKTPAYLSRVKGEVAQERAFVQSLEDAKRDRQQQVFSKYVYLLPHDEHEKLVNDLKLRSDECVSELQRMPYSKDTATMRKRRTELERTIDDIEVALKKLDKDALFIYKDDPVNGQWAKEAAMKEAQKYAAGGQ